MFPCNCEIGSCDLRSLLRSSADGLAAHSLQAAVTEWSAADDLAADAEIFRHSPVRIVRMFLNALRDPAENRELLETLVTSESQDSWGDFSSARDVLEAIDSPGVGESANLASGGAVDVAYVKVFSGISATQFRPSGIELIPMVVTTIWSPEARIWFIHQIGEYGHPDELPRSSPGIAPAPI